MRLVLLGDVMLGRLVNEFLRTAPPEYPWGDTLPVLRAADAVVINLECVIADSGAPQPGKLFTFRSDAKNVAALEAAHVAAVTLANNHSLDYGRDALEECLTLLRDRGIAVAGAGWSIAEARAPAMVPMGDGPLVLVAWTDNERDWEATAHATGMFYVPMAPGESRGDPRMDALLSTVGSAAGGGQCVIVSAHWGPNWGNDPMPEQVDVAHRLMDAGAEVIFGHSPHVFRGVEIYKGKPIFYSCGNFIDDYRIDEAERNDLSCISILDYEDGRLRRMLLRPTVIRHFQARLARDADREIVLDRLSRRCAALGTRTRIVVEGLEILL